MSDIFREVDEALQQEKMLKIWHEHKTTIVGAIVVLLLSTSGMTIYKNWDYKRNTKDTALMMGALDSKEPDSALTYVIQNMDANHVAIGKFILAGLAIENDKRSDAAALYLEAAESSKPPRDLRDLARILYVQNTDKPTLDILKPLLANEKSPWVWHARVEAAVIAASENDFAKAAAYLKDFENVTTIPLSLKQRGIALGHVYNLKQTTADKAES